MSKRYFSKPLFTFKDATETDSGSLGNWTSFRAVLFRVLELPSVGPWPSTLLGCLPFCTWRAVLAWRLFGSVGNTFVLAIDACGSEFTKERGTTAAMECPLFLFRDQRLNDRVGLFARDCGSGYFPLSDDDSAIALNFWMAAETLRVAGA